MGKLFGKEQGTDFHEHNMWNGAQDECFIFFPSLIPVQLLCLFSTRHILWPEKGVERVGLFRLTLDWTWYRISWGLYLQAA